MRRMFLPICWRIDVDLRREIIPSRVNIFKCTIAAAGRLPERKKTTQSGVFSGSFCSLHNVSLKWLLKVLSSLSFRTSEAIPENKTLDPYIYSRCRAEDGFAL